MAQDKPLSCEQQLRDSARLLCTGGEENQGGGERSTFTKGWELAGRVNPRHFSAWQSPVCFGILPCKFHITNTKIQIIFAYFMIFSPPNALFFEGSFCMSMHRQPRAHKGEDEELNSAWIPSKEKSGSEQLQAHSGAGWPWIRRGTGEQIPP